MDAPSQNRTDKPIFWTIGEGIAYAEIGVDTPNVRPPLLSEWEGARAAQFNSSSQRDRWLAGRTLAKALVRHTLQIHGMVEIRDGKSGEPVLFRNGLPVPDVWLSMVQRHGRIIAVVGNRPVAVDIRRVDPTLHRFGRHFLSSSESRSLRRTFREPGIATAAGWAIKEATLKALRRSQDTTLSSVTLDADLSVVVSDSRLVTMALRPTRDFVVAVVAKALSPQEQSLRALLQDSAAPTATQGAVERSMARVRRLAEAKRWNRVRWQT